MRQAALFWTLPAAVLSIGGAAGTPPGAPPYPREGMIVSGGVYSNCAACHGAAGQGGIGPALKGNPTLADSEFVLTVLLSGTEKMPAFGGQLDDAQLAAVASAVRTSWGNKYGIIDISTVARMRKRVASPS